MCSLFFFYGFVFTSVSVNSVLEIHNIYKYTNPLSDSWDGIISKRPKRECKVPFQESTWFLPFFRLPENPTTQSRVHGLPHSSCLSSTIQSQKCGLIKCLALCELHYFQCISARFGVSLFQVYRHFILNILSAISYSMNAILIVDFCFFFSLFYFFVSMSVYVYICINNMITMKLPTNALLRRTHDMNSSMSPRTWHILLLYYLN